MYQAIKSNRSFLIPYFILLIFIFPLFILYEKGEIHLCLNRFHNHFFDLFFKYITYMGDGWTAVIIAIAFALISFRHTLFLFLSYITGGGFVQILKRLVFEGFERPSKYFEGIADLYLVNDINLNSYNSMPSGHAATAFTIFLCLGIMVKNNLFKFACFIFALIVAYSRVYISQHFLEDIYVGSVVGVIMPLMLYNIIYCSEKKWLKSSILNLIAGKNKE